MKNENSTEARTWKSLIKMWKNIKKKKKTQEKKTLGIYNLN